MNISEVRIKLMDDPNDRLQAFCSITFDHSFVIRDLKIIQGTKGPFVAMPSRKLTDRCPECHTKNHLRASYCSDCGTELDPERAVRNSDGRAKLYADIAHPINTECRELIQECVIKAFEEELVRSKDPNYICKYDDYGEENFASLRHEEEADSSPDILPMSAHQKPEVQTSGDQQHRFDGANPSPGVPHEPNRKAASAQNRGEEEGFGAGVM